MAVVYVVAWAVSEVIRMSRNYFTGNLDERANPVIEALRRAKYLPNGWNQPAKGIRSQVNPISLGVLSHNLTTFGSARFISNLISSRSTTAPWPQQMRLFAPESIFSIVFHAGIHSKRRNQSHHIFATRQDLNQSGRSQYIIKICDLQDQIMRPFCSVGGA
jgi:hypothetical protein